MSCGFRVHQLHDSLSRASKAEVTNLASCIRIKRLDGYVVGFTEHDVDLVVGGMVYKALGGIDASSVSSGTEMAPDNLMLTGRVGSSNQRPRDEAQRLDGQITAIDLLAGKYDFAETEMFLVDYTAPNAGRLVQKKGVLGEISLKGDMFYAELRGLTQNLSQDGICNIYSICCRANLGDRKCRVNLAGFTANVSVTSVTDRQIFTSDNLASV